MEETHTSPEQKHMDVAVWNAKQKPEHDDEDKVSKIKNQKEKRKESKRKEYDI